MILTPGFVMLNYPRTGSTFAREALRLVYGDGGRLLARLFGAARYRELLLPIDRTSSAERARRRSQHGSYAQIPRGKRGLPVVSVTRHPLDREVSQYEHGFWRTHPPADERRIRARFPRFPDLSFAEFRGLQRSFGRDDVLKGATVRADVGPSTLHFLRFFHPRPDELLASLTDEAIDSGAVCAALPPIRFLHTERLLPELTELLLEAGLPPQRVALLNDLPAINAAASRRGRPWADYFTPELEREFRREERFLFAMFPEYAS